MEEDRPSIAEQFYQDIKLVLNTHPDRKDKAKFIQKVIIPKQNVLMGRGQTYLSVLEIYQRVYSLEGELAELTEAIWLSEFRLTPSVALEIADLVYFTQQPKSLIPFANSRLLYRVIGSICPNPDQMLNSFYAFCIVKYLTRINVDNLGIDLTKEERKALEERVIKKFFEDWGIPLRLE